MPFAYKKILQNLHLIGSPAAKLRMAVSKAGPVVSDNGNFIIDAPFPEELMKDPYTVRPPVPCPFCCSPPLATLVLSPLRCPPPVPSDCLRSRARADARDSC